MLLSIILLALVGGYIFFYNRFTKLNTMLREGWVGIETQLKRRQDLVPQLLKIIKEHVKDDNNILVDVMEKRNRARQSTTIKERQNMENYLSTSLREMFNFVEDYQELKDDVQYQKLHENLIGVENDIQNASRYYNNVVKDFNTALNTIPSSWIGKSMNFRNKFMFNLKEVEPKSFD